jgi:hypothetical protein
LAELVVHGDVGLPGRPLTFVAIDSARISRLNRKFFHFKEVRRVGQQRVVEFLSDSSVIHCDTNCVSEIQLLMVHRLL